ncbi:hypothetical protein HMSSN036_20240 [Paenibacillus macerans]|nr:hypothetical protein HMSSN036_20240 [Paenibacillus macerans]
MKLLEELVQGRPDFLAARNNLALGYYYLGHFDKAMGTVHEVLAQDPGNLHGLCNLAVFYQHEGNREAMEELAERLSNIVPFHQEHVFKLATTMGMLGRHEAAFGHFKRLLQNEEMRREPSVSHYAAVAAYYTGRYAEARRLWQHVKRLDPGSSVAGFYLAQLDQSGGGDEASKPFSVNYQYLLPFEEQLKRWETSEDGFPADLKDNPLVRSSFFWALRHGDAKTKLQVIQALGLIADQEVEEALQAFCWSRRKMST